MNPQEFGSFGGKNQYKLVESELQIFFSIIFKTIPERPEHLAQW